MGGFAVQAPKVVVHFYVSFLILLTLSAYCQVCGIWCHPGIRGDNSGERWYWGVIPPWGGWSLGGRVWVYLGMYLGHLSPPIVCNFAPEQASNPCDFMHLLIKGCLVYTSKRQKLLALFWGLTCAAEPQFSTIRALWLREGTRRPLRVPWLERDPNYK